MDDILRRYSIIPLRILDKMISFLEGLQDYSSQDKKKEIEADIEKIMEYIDMHYYWSSEHTSFFEYYNEIEKLIKQHGE